jgi:hypothetical protein
MTRLVLIASCLVALALPGVAQARWFLTEGLAEHATRVVVHDRYADYGVEASCRPYARDFAAVGFTYHRFVCGWAGYYDNPNGERLLCHGQLAIAGSRYYTWQWWVLRGERCEQA